MLKLQEQVYLILFFKTGFARPNVLSKIGVFVLSSELSSPCNKLLMGIMVMLEPCLTILEILLFFITGTSNKLGKLLLERSV